MHPRVREHLDSYAEAWVYLADKLNDMKPGLIDQDEFLSVVNCGMVGLEKSTGFPMDNPPGAPVPDFQRADEKAQLISSADKPNGSATSSAQPSKEQPKPEPPKETSKLTNQPKGPAYDRVKLRFNFCPTCTSTDINKHSEAKNRDYQSCVPCGVFLNADGKLTPMKKEERK